MAEVTTTGTGPIASQGKTPGDILMENLLNSVVSPTVNSLLDISATSTGTGTAATTGTKSETQTQTGTKTTGTTSAAQALIDQQIAQIQGQLTGGDQQYSDMLGNILTQAAQTFNPTNATSRRSGAYNSTTLDQLRNDAQAKATAAGAGAVLEDKRAKLASLVSLIEQNATLNKTEAVSSTGTTTGSNTSNTTENKSTTTEGNKVGSGAADTAKVAAAALLAKQALGTEAGKNLTTTGIKALEKLLGMTTSTGAVSGTVAGDFTTALGGGLSADNISSLLGMTDYWSSLGSATNSSALSGFYSDPFTGAVTGTGAEATTGGVLEGFYNNDLSWFSDAGAASGADAAGGAAVSNSFADAITANAGAFGAGGLTAAINLADGEWGWKDTGATAGAAIGSLFGPLGTAAGSFIGGAIGEPVGDIVEGVGGFIGETSDSLLGWADDGCFITTACMKAQGTLFADNCHELTQLRFVRDNYIKFLPNGPVLLAAYKEFAPKYVELINRLDDSAKVWSDLYTMFIAPAVEFVDEGNNKNAYLTYLLMFQYIQELTSFGGA